MKRGSIERRGSKIYIRIRLGAKSRPRFETHLSSDSEAQRRAVTVAELVDVLIAAGKDTAFVKRFASKAALASETELKVLGKACKDFARGDLVSRNSAQAWSTFGELADAWTTGKLRAEHADFDKRRPDSVAKASQVLRLHVLPHVQDVPLALFTIEHAQRVMRAIPSRRSSATRRHVAQVMHRVLKLAVYPCRLIAVSPLPPGFLPSVKRERTSAFLYPAEEAALMKCGTIPLVERLFFGILAREGMRESELHGLEWKDVDLKNGSVRLDVNKTDDPRSWALDAGVREALQRVRALRGNPADGTRIFIGEDGKLLSLAKIAVRFRSALLAAGVGRAELHEDTDKRQPTRVHDIRVAFVTVSLANGKTEAWVTDRTGHKSSTMIARYRRKARSVAEMHLGSFQPLYLAIPELAALGLAPSWPQAVATGSDPQRNRRGTPRSRPVATASPQFKISGSQERPGSTPGGATRLVFTGTGR